MHLINPSLADRGVHSNLAPAGPQNNAPPARSTRRRLRLSATACAAASSATKPPAPPKPPAAAPTPKKPTTTSPLPKKRPQEEPAPSAAAEAPKKPKPAPPPPAAAAAPPPAPAAAAAASADIGGNLTKEQRKEVYEKAIDLKATKTAIAGYLIHGWKIVCEPRENSSNGSSTQVDIYVFPPNKTARKDAIRSLTRLK